VKILFLLALASAAAWGQGFVDVKDWSTVRIRLEHTPCATPCSVFSIEIAGDGTIEYNGQSLVAVLGKHRDRMERGDVESILGRLRGAEAYALRDENGSDVSNVPGRRLSWSIDGVEKSLLYADGDQLKAIADLVKSIERRTQIDKWVFGTADTVAALRAEGFDLKSEDAGRLLARISYWGNTAAVRELIAAGARSFARSRSSARCMCRRPIIPRC
jgi:hypothetical protein